MSLLDRIDHEIVQRLRNNARLTNKELAQQIGIAPSTCLERVRRLRVKRVLTGFHAEVDPAALGVSMQAMVSVRLNRHSRPEVEAFGRHVLGLPEVVQLFHVAGDNDFLVQVAVRDADHLRELAMTAFTERPEVAQIQTWLIFEHQRSANLPMYVERTED